MAKEVEYTLDELAVIEELASGAGAEFVRNILEMAETEPVREHHAILAFEEINKRSRLSFGQHLN